MAKSAFTSGADYITAFCNVFSDSVRPRLRCVRSSPLISENDLAEDLLRFRSFTVVKEPVSESIADCCFTESAGLITNFFQHLSRGCFGLIQADEFVVVAVFDDVQIRFDSGDDLCRLFFSAE